MVTAPPGRVVPNPFQPAADERVPDDDYYDLVYSIFDYTDKINADLIPSAAPITSSYFDLQDLINYHPVP
jgi:hypothetical protein